MAKRTIGMISDACRDVMLWCIVLVAMFIVDDGHSLYLWLGRRAADNTVNTTADGCATCTADQNGSDSLLAAGPTASARLTAAKIRAMQTTLAYCTGMLPLLLLTHNHCYHIVR